MRAELIAESVIAPLLVPEDLRGPIRGVRYQVLDRAIHEFAMDDAGVERVKIWNVDGMVVFPNDREQVGLRPEMEEDLLEAFEGEVASEISDLSEAENVSERALADQLFETYVPVHLPGDGESTEATAVIEVYQDYSAIQLEIDHLNDTLKISLGIGLLVLYVLLLPRDGRHHPDPPSSERPTLGAGGSARGAAGTGAGDGGGAPRARPAEERLRGCGLPRAPDTADHDPRLRRPPQGSRTRRRSRHERCDRRDRSADGAPATPRRQSPPRGPAGARRSRDPGGVHLDRRCAGRRPPRVPGVRGSHPCPSRAGHPEHAARSRDAARDRRQPRGQRPEVLHARRPPSRSRRRSRGARW